MTTALAKGTNAALGAGPVRVEVRCAAALDLSALLVTAVGKVRDDADFVFFNQPHGAGVRLGPEGIDVDPAAVPADIERIVVTASVDAPATFGAVGAVSVAVTAGGIDQVTFTPGGLGPETALMLIELYRRQGAWKVRAIGQGWASGLAGIATDFGITVADAAPPPASTPPASTPPPPPPPPPPPSTPLPPPPPPSTQAAPPSLRKLSLDQGKVSLAKGQSVSLTKVGAAAFVKVAMGLGWDPVAGGRNIDLDASCIALGKGGKKLDTVWFMGKKAFDGAILHSGDNVTGAGEGDDETIEVDLAALPLEVEALVFTVNSFAGQKFTMVKNAFCRLIDHGSGNELARFDLGASEARTGVLMCVVHRRDGAWDMTAIGEFHDGKTVRAMVKPAEELWRERAARLAR